MPGLQAKLSGILGAMAIQMMQLEKTWEKKRMVWFGFLSLLCLTVPYSFMHIRYGMNVDS